MPDEQIDKIVKALKKMNSDQAEELILVLSRIALMMEKNYQDKHQTNGV